MNIDENEVKKSWLKMQGWKEGEPFVCLLVRDDAFNNKKSDLIDI